MADSQKTGQDHSVTPFKGKTLIRSPIEAKDQTPIPGTSTSSSQKRLAASPLEGQSSKKTDNTELESPINSDSDQEPVMDHEDESQNANPNDEEFTRTFLKTPQMVYFQWITYKD